MCTNRVQLSFAEITTTKKKEKKKKEERERSVTLYLKCVLFIFKRQTEIKLIGFEDKFTSVRELRKGIHHEVNPKTILLGVRSSD